MMIMMMMSLVLPTSMTLFPVRKKLTKPAGSSKYATLAKASGSLRLSQRSLVPVKLGTLDIEVKQDGIEGSMLRWSMWGDSHPLTILYPSCCEISLASAELSVSHQSLAGRIT